MKTIVLSNLKQVFETIMTLKNCNYRMCNELGDCETKYQNMVGEISQLNNIIDDRNMVIDTMKKTIAEKENLINSLYNQISSIQYNNQSKIEEMRNEHETLFNDFMNEYSQHSETLKENEQLKIDIKSYKQQIEDISKQNDYLHKKIRKMMK